MSEDCIGIDLGTTYSCVGVWQNGRVEIIANDQGSRTTPSYVSFDGEQRFVGAAAKSMCSKNPTNTVFDAKRLIGRRFDEPSVQNDLKHFPFEVVEYGGQPVIQVDYMGGKKVFRPEEISSMVLGYLKKTAENYLGHDVKSAVITVPAYFNDSQRQATKDAGRIAGLNVLRVINEPTAAAIAYGLDKGTTTERNILVFDLGGGTFDVSLLNVADGVFEVLATSGDTHLGGEDFDNLVVDEVLKDFTKRNPKLSNVADSKRAVRRLRTEVERAKHTLSSEGVTQATIDLEAFHEGKDHRYVLTRAKFESLCDSLFKKTLDPVERVLKDSGKSKSDVDEVVMVGGSTRIPKIQKIVSDFFNGKKLNLGINPDEAVAYGASVQAALLTDNADAKEATGGGLLLIDVAPLSLGLETEGGLMDVLIPRQTKIPHTEKKVYSTAKNNQTGVTIQIFEGERKMTKDNNKLGEFQVTGIPPMPRGVPQVEVTFKMDANGILIVSAMEVSTGKNNQIQIKNERGRMSDDEIKSKIVEASRYREQDDKNFRKVQARNDYESYLYAVMNSEDTIKDLSEDDKKSLREISEEGIEWLNNNADADLVEVKIQRDSTEPRVNAIYSKYSGNPPTTDAESADTHTDDVD